MDCNSSASCLTHALTICEGLKQNAYEDLIEPIQLGLKWIYANQPDPSAALSPAGIVFHGDLPQNIGEIRICPVGYQKLPMFVFESNFFTEKNVSAPDSFYGQRFSFTETEITSLAALIMDAGGVIADIYHKTGSEISYFVLQESAHPSLGRAVEICLQYCTRHNTYHCGGSCFPSEKFFKKMMVPNNWF